MTPPLEAAELLRPERSALVVVDVQNDYCDPAGALGMAGLDLSAIDPMCNVIERLRAAAARAGVLTVLLRTVHSDATDSAPWLRRARWSGGVCRENSWGTGFYRMKPAPADVVVTKHRYSGFLGTPLERVLRRHGRTTVAVAGTSTEVCVESTVRDACMRDFDVVVVEDAVASTDEHAHRCSLDTVGRFFGSVVSSAAVERSWRPAADDRGAA